ncbi:MAG: membrane protein insertase YidC [Gammaproteobacteria bacterium]|nr:membrane protein insertase YidC [Gammaproteobacteria bacterium]
MDNVRLFLIMALAFLGMLIYQAWQEDYGIASRQAEQPAETLAAQQRAAVDTPDAPTHADIDAATPTVPGVQDADSAQTDATLIRVHTDTLDLVIDSRGATIVDARLVQYPVAVDQPDVKYRLLSQRSSDYFILQSGLLGADAPRTPTHEAVFTTAAAEYRMADDADSLSVDFVWRSDDGVTVTKRYTFNRGTHAVELQHIVDNASATAWTGREYRQLQRGEKADDGNVFMYTYTGGAVYTQQDKYQKYDFDDLGAGQLDRDAVDGWVSMIQHYFLAAIVPPRGEEQHFYGKRLPNGRAVIGAYTPAKTVAPGSRDGFTGTLFIGPKLQAELEQIAEGLDLTVDYGWLVFIAKPMYWVLDKIQGVVHNWGWTIIIFTILIKLAFFKLSETSYRSMANMRKLTPRIQALKDRYGDDKQRMQQAMMEMYKTEKINPLGGCLPMLVQIPFFIALYWVLLESVELRQAPWILWIDDLSIKDPFFVLPLIMGVSMFIQQKLNPPPPDPMQAKILMFLPVVFTVMFAFFPSGLVLYWVVNNILSIAQQWVITKRIEEGAKA